MDLSQFLRQVQGCFPEIREVHAMVVLLRLFYFSLNIDSLLAHKELNAP